MSGSPLPEARVGAAEKWISSQAGNACSTPPSTSPKTSNPSSPNAGFSWSGTPPFRRSQSPAHDSIASLSFNIGSASGLSSSIATKFNFVAHSNTAASSGGLVLGTCEKLYEAYNELHGLAQDFHKPFDAPAILVVGHQTDGKSALIEALMGFQFNHVGGGTKTRRPITLHMKYSATCEEPICYLLSEENPPREEEKGLEDIQAYIEAENMRLEQEACQFWAKEIIIRIEYKYCPNLTIIDTPGLIAAAPGRKNRVLQAQARAVEALVRSKMQHREFIILCLEDCSDWSNATTRRVVMQVDPELSRTVIVSTKLDTKIPQFGRSTDVELFLRPPTRVFDGSILGETPFFTSVPSGRVGMNRDSVYRLNDQFKEAVALREAQDVATLEEKLGRPLLKEERARVGVSRLRSFLEELLQRRYMDNVPLIVPLLDKEYRNITRKLRSIIQELGNLDETKLKEKGRLFRDSFLAKLSLLLKGTVVAPPDRFGRDSAR
eukprot:Gb_04150 [translate_table: standard]